MKGHFRKAGVPPKAVVKEFPVTPDAHVPVGAYCIYITYARLPDSKKYQRHPAFCDSFRSRPIRRHSRNLVRAELIISRMTTDSISIDLEKDSRVV